MKPKIKFYTRGKSGRLFYLYTSHPFFKTGEEIITKITQDCIKFTKPSMNYKGKINVVGKPPHWEGVHKLNFSSDVKIPVNKNLRRRRRK